MYASHTIGKPKIKFYVNTFTLKEIISQTVFEDKMTKY